MRKSKQWLFFEIHLHLEPTTTLGEIQCKRKKYPIQYYRSINASKQPKYLGMRAEGSIKNRFPSIAYTQVCIVLLYLTLSEIESSLVGTLELVTVFLDGLHCRIRKSWSLTFSYLFRAWFYKKLLYFFLIQEIMDRCHFDQSLCIYLLI